MSDYFKARYKSIAATLSDVVEKKNRAKAIYNRLCEAHEAGRAEAKKGLRDYLEVPSFDDIDVVSARVSNIEGDHG